MNPGHMNIAGPALAAPGDQLARELRGDGDHRGPPISGTREDKQRHIVGDCTPEEPRESTKPYAFAQTTIL